MPPHWCFFRLRRCSLRISTSCSTRAGDASYTAEQVITCSTPDGAHQRVIELSQASGELHIGAPVAPDVEVASGFGGWTLVREGSVVSSANVQGAGEEPEPRYTVDEGTDTEYLGRDATLYRMTGDGVVRGELVFDVEAGRCFGW